MISKNDYEINLMRRAGEITRDCLIEVAKHISPGISTYELDRIAKTFIEEQDAVPGFLHYNGFPCSICASVNDVVVHGIPSKKVVLQEGDIISIDLGACYKGYNGDAARTFPVGKVDDEILKLIQVTEQSFFEGIKDLKVGDRIGKISNAIETHINKFGYGIVRELVGHGVGKNLHESPNIPNYGYVNSGERIVSGACLAIEPMITLGSPDIYMKRDGWTIATQDGLPCAHYENTVLVTEKGVEILTL